MIAFLVSVLLAVSVPPDRWEISWTPHPDNKGIWIEYNCADEQALWFQAVDEFEIQPEQSKAVVFRLPLPQESPDGVGCSVIFHILRGEHRLEPQKWEIAESLVIAWKP